MLLPPAQRGFEGPRPDRPTRHDRSTSPSPTTSNDCWWLSRSGTGWTMSVRPFGPPPAKSPRPRDSRCSPGATDRRFEWPRAGSSSTRPQTAAWSRAIPRSSRAGLRAPRSGGLAASRRVDRLRASRVSRGSTHDPTGSCRCVTGPGQPHRDRPRSSGPGRPRSGRRVRQTDPQGRVPTRRCRHTGRRSPWRTDRRR